MKQHDNSSARLLDADSPMTDDERIAELRYWLPRLELGMNVLVSSRNDSFTMPWTVAQVSRGDSWIEVILDGARGATYRIRDNAAKMDRPAVDYLDPRDGWKPVGGKNDGELHSLLLGTVN